MRRTSARGLSLAPTVLQTRAVNEKQPWLLLSQEQHLSWDKEERSRKREEGRGRWSWLRPLMIMGSGPYFSKAQLPTSE